MAGKNSKAPPAKCSVSDFRVSDHSSELAESFKAIPEHEFWLFAELVTPA